MNVFFIQKPSGSGRSNTNSMPWSGCRLKRFMSPVARSWGLDATSATIFWPLIVSATVGKVVAHCAAPTEVKVNAMTANAGRAR